MNQHDEAIREMFNVIKMTTEQLNNSNEEVVRLAKICDQLLERQQQLYDLNVRHEEIMTLGLHRMAMHLDIDWDSFCKGINDERAEWIQKRDIEHLTNCWGDGDDDD